MISRLLCSVGLHAWVEYYVGTGPHRWRERVCSRWQCKRTERRVWCPAGSGLHHWEEIGAWLGRRDAVTGARIR